RDRRFVPGASLRPALGRPRGPAALDPRAPPPRSLHALARHVGRIAPQARVEEVPGAGAPGRDARRRGRPPIRLGPPRAAPRSVLRLRYAPPRGPPSPRGRPTPGPSPQGLGVAPAPPPPRGTGGPPRP